MEKRENLSEKEKKFLKKKSRWRKIITFFFPIIASAYLNKNDSYVWISGSLIIIAAICSAIWQDQREAGLLALSFLFVIFSKLVAVSDFTRLCYKSNPYLFKDFIDEYHNYRSVKLDEDWYDEFWFNKSWIHRDTWTKYDKNWFNRDARVALKNAWWE